MKIQFLGTGGAFDLKYGNSSAIINHRGRNVLIDCGFTVLSRLVETGWVDKVDELIITHMHDDHVGSLSGFLLFRKHINGQDPIPVIVPNREFAEHLTGFLSYSMQDPSPYLEYRYMDEEDTGIRAIDTYGRHVPDFQTWAYVFSEGDDHIVYSGDLGDCDFLMERVEAMELINPLVFHEVAFYPKVPAHTHFEELRPWANKYRIYGYHCDPERAPADSGINLVYNNPEFMVAVTA